MRRMTWPIRSCENNYNEIAAFNSERYMNTAHWKITTPAYAPPNPIRLVNLAFECVGAPTSPLRPCWSQLSGLFVHQSCSVADWEDRVLVIRPLPWSCAPTTNDNSEPNYSEKPDSGPHANTCCCPGFEPSSIITRGGLGG
jgi:hypothetical protein